MADNIISSFLVALGFDDASASAMVGKTKKTMADYEKAVKDAEKRIEDARWEGQKTQEEIAKLTREANLKEARAALATAQEREKSEKETARKREERNKEFMSGLNKAALAATAAATAIGYAVTKVAGAFDNLGFVSQRTGASVQGLNSLAYAFKQTGGSAQQAIGFVEKFAQAIRSNDGLKGMLKSLGVDTTQSTENQAVATVEALSKHEYQVGSREAGLFGISEEDYKLVTDHLRQIREYRDEYNRTTRSLGIDSQKATEASQSFWRSLNKLQATASALTDKLMVSLAPALEAIVKRFNDWIEAHPEQVNKILTDITNGLVFIAEKFKQFGDWMIGGGGDELLKRWDDFARRVERVAKGIEIIAKAASYIGFNSSVREYGGAHGDPGRTAALLGELQAQRGAGKDERTFWQRHAPRILGGKDAPSADGGDFGRLNARSPEGPGKYRPQYKLSDADLSQAVVNVIAGEAIARNPESTDAVINNMLNRVGSKGWGPSGDLRAVATAPGQYAGNRSAGAAESEWIRSRIRAIASGGLPDNTNGANSYRASWYNGPWAQKHASDGRVVGGNRYAFEKGFPNGPYAPYATPKAGGPTFSPGAFDPNNIDPKNLMPPAPGSASPTTNNTSNSRSVTQHISNTTTITGTDRPRETAKVMESAFGRMHGLALANAQSAVA